MVVHCSALSAFRACIVDGQQACAHPQSESSAPMCSNYIKAQSLERTQAVGSASDVPDRHRSRPDGITQENKIGEWYLFTVVNQ